MADNTTTYNDSVQSSLRNAALAALERIREGEQESSDATVVNAYFNQLEQGTIPHRNETWQSTTSSGSQNSKGSSDQKSTQDSKSSSVSGRRSPELEYDENGVVTKESLERLNNEDAQFLTQAHTLSSAIGASRQKAAEERAKQEDMLRKKQKMNELVESGRVLSDIISAGIGGNVYKRDKNPDDTDDKILRLRELQAAEDAANAQADYKNQLELAYAILGAKRANRELATQTVQSNTSSSTANSHSTTDSAKNKSKSTTSGSSKVGLPITNNGYAGLDEDDTE